MKTQQTQQQQAETMFEIAGIVTGAIRIAVTIALAYGAVKVLV